MKWINNIEVNVQGIHKQVICLKGQENYTGYYAMRSNFVWALIKDETA